MLRWMSGNTLRIINDCIYKKLKVTSIEEKMRKNQLDVLGICNKANKCVD